MLETFIKEKIQKIANRELDDTIVEFKDTKTKFIVPKSTVMVEVALKSGLIAKIEVTDFFKEVL